VWKKCSNNKIVKLEVPTKAKRTACFESRKCRAEYVKTVAIFNTAGKKLTTTKNVSGMHDANVVYTVGKITRPDSYNPDPREECTNGIHFFLTFEEARDY